MKRTRFKRFASEKSAKGFSKKVNGKIEDLREIKGANCNFKVFYKPREFEQRQFDDDWAPEDDRDFGYPNWFWK